jgi:hypothetical protein
MKKLFILPLFPRQLTKVNVMKFILNALELVLIFFTMFTAIIIVPLFLFYLLRVLLAR